MPARAFFTQERLDITKSGSVRIDGGLLSRLDRLVLRLESSFALLSGLAVFLLMVLAVVSVSGRNFFNQPLPGYVDWIEQAMPLIAFMGVAYVQRYGAHIRMDFFLSQIKGRLLWTIEFGTTLTILLVMLVLVYGSYTHFDRSFDLDAPLWSRDSSMDIAIPLWPAKLLVPLAFAVLCLRLSLQLWAYGQAVFSGTKDPIAVPLIENAAQQAASEAASVSGYRDDTLGEDQPRV